ncbi:MAG: tripartite tricarboxylate transporter TctB family protein [Castellaniella sp.]|uniref:tripartite tricarboxylate transporter TctB family protein n=1 Tax=Castellaniella sp. TaxID=1955812 RepID=UPI003C76EDE2
MNQDTRQGPGNGAEERGGISLRVGGLFTSSMLMLIAAVVMIDSLDQGIGWDVAGPQAGYFPFYIGLLMFLACLGTAVRTILHWPEGRGRLTTKTELRQVLNVFLPIVAYVVLMFFVGMYVSAALFLAWFMWRLAESGKPHPIWKILLISISVPLATYFIFTVWFEVNLYAGPFADF